MKSYQAKLQSRIRKRYQEKRLGKTYEIRRLKRLQSWKNSPQYNSENRYKSYDVHNLVAPNNFSLIENTDNILSYIKTARKVLRGKNSVKIDISQIKRLTPDIIPFLISHLRDQNFNQFMPIHGNAPENEIFKKIFTESGFYKYVQSKSKFQTSKLNIMHNESNFKVKPDIAGTAVELILEGRKYDEAYIEPIYNIFIELMSNTHHHADLKEYGTSKWWLYVYVDEENKKTSISFLDLGVGIFKSLIVRSYLKRIGQTLKLVNNSLLVQDILSGKIQSRIEIDKEIRGKGIPQIVEYAKYGCFESFYLITNNMKIDLKNGTYIKLNEELKGTFYFIQINHN